MLRAAKKRHCFFVDEIPDPISKIHPVGRFQTVEKIAQTLNGCPDFLIAPAVLANRAHIHTYYPLICKPAALYCTIFLGLTKLIDKLENRS